MKLAPVRRAIRDVVYRGMTWAFGDEKDYVSLTTMRGPGQGLRFKLDLIRTVESHYWFGIYDLHILRQLTEIVQPGWVVWDCGIYLGYYTAIFARLVGNHGHVVAFEPDPTNLERSQSHVAINNLRNVQFVHAAIGAPIGYSDFIVARNTNSHLPGAYIGGDPNDYSMRERIDEMIRVRCMSLNEAFEDPLIPEPNLIKIDIEGAEEVALKYVDRLVSNRRPLIVLELHNPVCDAAAWHFAKRANYRLRSMDSGAFIEQEEDVRGTLLCIPQE